MLRPGALSIATAIGLTVFLQSPLSAQTLDPNAAVGQIKDLIERHYVVQERIRAIVGALESGRVQGRYRNLTTPQQFADLLTRDLRTASNDRHLYVKAFLPKAGADASNWEAAERVKETETNFGIPHVQTFPGGVGYVQITSFMEPQRALPSLTAAMEQVRTARAIVFDLRGNGGGYGGLPGYLATYFFEPGPTLLAKHYSQEEQPALVETTYTDAAVVGERHVGTPVYILVDRKTGSAAEWFAYIMQSFGKARIVGEQSAGAAYTNSYFPLPEGMRLSVSTGRPVSAANGKNWEGTGITPDLPCPADEALKVALAAARTLK